MTKNKGKKENFEGINIEIVNIQVEKNMKNVEL